MTQRPIKFRAWDEEDKRFYYFALGIWDDVMVSEFRRLNLNGATFQQFTGLHDKNGKEIWEGDVVWAVDKYETCVIEYWDASFVAVRETGRPFELDEHLAKYELQVIGNIYENPDLLTN